MVATSGLTTWTRYSRENIKWFRVTLLTHILSAGRAAVFPPDKEEAIISCGDNDQGVTSSGSEDGRSSLATPSMSVSCLHHSYETLNMSDPGLGVLSQPHRPAPKPPQAHSDDPGECRCDFKQPRMGFLSCAERDKRTRLIRLFDH